MSKSGAGHTIRGKYRVYGEGAESHGGHPCEYGLGEYERHPLIMRHDYDSVWHYRRTEIADWWEMRRSTRFYRKMRLEKMALPTTIRMIDIPYSPLDRLMLRWFGEPFARVPTVYAALKPEDSIYPKEEA